MADSQAQDAAAPSAFIARILPAAQASQKQSGVPASLAIAQAALESNWGRSGLTQRANNLFGMKGTGPAGSVTMQTTEVVNGRPVKVDAAFRAYRDWNESVADYTALLSGNKRYAKVPRTDGKSAARAVAAAGYATDPKYADKLIFIMDTYNLTKYDAVKAPDGGGNGTLATPGIDCSTPLTAQTAKNVAAAGYKFAARYLVPQQYAWKRLTPAEAKAITDAGMQIVSVYETTANRPAGGASAGRSDGAAALKEARTVGQPPGSAIYFAVDYDAQPRDYDEIEAYLKAAASEIPGYSVGVYGSYAVVEEMHRRKACSHFWQTYAWSRGKTSDHANIYQYQNGTQVAGVAVDLNRSYGGEGWWNANTNANPNPNPDPDPDPSEGENEMSQQDAEKIIRFLSAAYFAAADQASKDEFNRLANEVRKAAGIPPVTS